MTRPKRNHHTARGHSGVASRAVVKSSSPTWCAKHDKRKYTSRAQALKAGEQKYGAQSNAYLCACGSWHLTRRNTRLDPNRATESSANDAADALVAALGIGDDEP
jgi:hypothetical protein